MVNTKIASAASPARPCRLEDRELVVEITILVVSFRSVGAFCARDTPSMRPRWPGRSHYPHDVAPLSRFRRFTRWRAAILRFLDNYSRLDQV